MAIAVCTPVMAAEITTTEDAVIENSPEVAAGSLESVGLEEISPMSLSEEHYDVLFDDEIHFFWSIIHFILNTYPKISQPI